jgi:hypothetical protein
MSQLSRGLYHAARISNKVRIYAQAASGHPAHLVKHIRNRGYFRLFGRFLR